MNHHLLDVQSVIAHLEMSDATYLHFTSQQLNLCGEATIVQFWLLAISFKFAVFLWVFIHKIYINETRKCEDYLTVVNVQDSREKQLQRDISMRPSVDVSIYWLTQTAVI